MALFSLRTLLGVLLLLHLPITMAQQVSVSGGRVSGHAMPDGSTIFYGIPYAAAPSGQLRWKRPAPRAPWVGVRDSSKQAPACVQADAGWNGALIKDASEDCLTVAIRTPTLDRQTRLPVLVYIHGGSNAAGAAGSLEQDALHREGIVLVKIQYRLGAFGFLGLEALRKEDPHQSSANYGLLDQIAALKWVKANISAVGGDPARVTISGSSAGATDALFLTYSPLAKGLFQRAIIQSAAPGAPRTAAHSEAMGNELLARLKLAAGVAGLAALRKLPADKINAAALNLPVSPGVDTGFTWEQLNLDGYVLPHSYAAAHAKGAGRCSHRHRKQYAGARGRSQGGRRPSNGAGGIRREGGRCAGLARLPQWQGAESRSVARQCADAGYDRYVVPLASASHARCRDTGVALRIRLRRAWFGQAAKAHYRDGLRVSRATVCDCARRLAAGAALLGEFHSQW